MRQLSLQKSIDRWINSTGIWQNKKALTSAWKPGQLPHRDQEIDRLVAILAPALRLEKPSNVFIYGKTGTGKTAVCQHVSYELRVAAERARKDVRMIYTNCKLAGLCNTEYRLLATLTREFGVEVPTTGLPLSKIYQTFWQAIDSSKRIIIIILDEIDTLVKKIGDSFLYSLTRINEVLEQAQISLIGITNDLALIGGLDPRVRSSLSEEEILFTPYNAIHLEDILTQRAKEAFRQNVIQPGVIQKCAALAAQEHGDARRALDLLRIAGEIAERAGSTKLKPRHLDLAEAQLDRNRIIETVRSQPRQSQAVLLSIIKLSEKNGGRIQTGDIFTIYEQICQEVGLRSLTQRRVSDLISELDMLGIINTSVISRGRYGRTRAIRFAFSQPILKQVKSILQEI